MKKFFGAGLFAFALAATSTVASAATACIGPLGPGPATNLIENAAGTANVLPGFSSPTSNIGNASQSCTIGFETFSNFQYTLTPTSGFIGNNFDILVNGGVPYAGGPVNLEFNPGTAANSDLQLEFEVTGSAMTSVSLGFNGASGGVNETVCTIYMPTGICTAAPIGVGGTSSLVVVPTSQSATLNFITAQSTIWVFKDIEAGTGFFSEVNQGFTVPEPMTFSLLGAGLLGLGLMGRRRRASK
jgi:hypothetical protein